MIIKTNNRIIKKSSDIDSLIAKMPYKLILKKEDIYKDDESINEIIIFIYCNYPNVKSNYNIQAYKYWHTNTPIFIKQLKGLLNRHTWLYWFSTFKEAKTYVKKLINDYT